MIKLGMKVLLKQSGVVATVSKILDENGQGELCQDGHPAATKMFLDSEYGPCKVYQHDQGKTWLSYLDMN